MQRISILIAIVLVMSMICLSSTLLASHSIGYNDVASHSIGYADNFSA